MFAALTDTEFDMLYSKLNRAWRENPYSPFGIELDGILYEMETRGVAARRAFDMAPGV